ncbi:hypothetical protein [Streptomyces hoynatensis]|uniref:Uncharacterized protein n=1 Tax=Streptomyces hoynatensis TaxID=1141874 RepID=A0A3A9Z8Z5_9ACTN|nr:hypothetical protein [Streptomyces hoynatensis]RKN44841.1 hypothetical protein D7294_06900 [Streptomyces hoynatensis]
MSTGGGEAEFEAALREAFERRGREAPAAAGLLEAVLARRRRQTRHRVAGAAVATALVAAGTLLGAQLLRGGEPAGPAAGVPAPGIFAAEEIELCLLPGGGDPAEVLLSAEVGGEEVQTAISEPAGDAFRLHVERAPGYTVRLDVLRGSVAGEPLDGARDVRAGDRPGRIGDAPGGGRVLLLETGTEGVLLRLTAEGTGPGDAELLAWAAKITVSTGRDACES